MGLNYKKFRTIATACFMLMPFADIQAQRIFIHPGSILTANDLKRIKEHVEAKDEPWATAWNEMQASSYANCSRTPNPSTEIGGSNGTRQRASADAYAALTDAIEWHVTGKKTYADHAVKLLSAWGNKVTTANEQLFQFPARTMSIAAEMLRYEDGTFYEGWDAADLDNFKTMVRDVLVPACRSQATNNPMTSWSAPAATAVMAAGILLDDEALYDEALGYFRSKTVSGSVYSSIADDGQVIEMGRDNVHAMLTLNDLAQMAQMAWAQGDDLWGEDDNRLLKSFEYFCTYNMGHEDVSYSPITSSDGSSHWYYISTHNNGFRLLPDGHCYECVYHHYKEQKHIDLDAVAPNLTAFARLTRPQGESESLGFGTLLFTVDAEASTFVSATPSPAENLEATAGEGRVWLKWKDNQLNDASGVRILRSHDGVSFGTLADLNNYTRKSFVDETAESGQTYSYKVVLYNKCGDAQESETVTARVPIADGLPRGWNIANIGNGWTQAFFTNSQANSFIVKGGGNGFRRNDEGHGFVYHKLKGNGSLTVRIISTEQTFNAVGIILRASLSSGSKQMGVTLGGTGWRYCHSIARTSTGGNTSWTTGCDFTYAPVWMRIERAGNTVSTYQSRDGMTWHLIQQESFALPSTVYIGMLIASDNSYRASFDNVMLTSENEQQASSSAPADLKASCMPEGTVRLVWQGVYEAEKYIVYRDGVAVGETVTNSYDDLHLADGTYCYSVSTVTDGAESERSESVCVDIVHVVKLSGTIIGTYGSWNNNSSTTRTAVFDGLLDTFFDAAQANGAWAGIDLGEGREARVTNIRFCPRQSHPERMVGGRFQAATQASFNNATNLYTISKTPDTATLTTVAIDIPESFRFLRYVSPDGGYGNVAEVEFYGVLKDDEKTGIKPVMTDSDARRQDIHDLQGRRVKSCERQKGVYICNGQKTGFSVW